MKYNYINLRNHYNENKLLSLEKAFSFLNTFFLHYFFYVKKRLHEIVILKE